MDDLKRALAPVSEAAWAEIDETARQTLETYLAARKVVDFEGPLGWRHAAATTGRVRPLEPSPAESVVARVRLVQPLIELRARFQLARAELDAVDRGAAGPDLAPLVHAARQLAAAEDQLVFEGSDEACLVGLARGSPHPPLALSDDVTTYPGAITAAAEALREAGVAGPYALALGPRSFTGLARTTGPGGYPVIRHVRELLDGPVVWAPSLAGALVLSMRGGDFLLQVGRDVSIGYLRHDDETVDLYFEESLTFRNVAPEAAVVLRH